MNKTAAGLLSVFFGAFAFGANIDPRVPIEKYVEYRKQFPCVVEFCGTYDDGTSFNAEAVVIDPHWFLTTASTVHKSVKKSHIKVKNVEKKVVFLQVHEKFDNDKFCFDHDIAMGYVKEDIGLESYPDLYDKFDEEKKECSISARCWTGFLDRGATGEKPLLIMGKNKVFGLHTDGDLVVRAKINNSDLDILVFKGDSGGGLFIDGKLAGLNHAIMSKGRESRSRYEDESMHTRISTHIDWINSVKQK